MILELSVFPWSFPYECFGLTGLTLLKLQGLVRPAGVESLPWLSAILQGVGPHWQSTYSRHLWASRWGDVTFGCRAHQAITAI